jgi:hypothetical protein
MVFVQVAAAAATCFDHVGGERIAPQACGQALDQQHGAGDAICASEFLPANQMAADEPILRVPDPGPMLAVAALWPPAPQMRAQHAAPVAAPFASVPRFLTFGRLLR